MTHLRDGFIVAKVGIGEADRSRQTLPRHGTPTASSAHASAEAITRYLKASALDLIKTKKDLIKPKKRGFQPLGMHPLSPAQ